MFNKKFIPSIAFINTVVNGERIAHAVKPNDELEQLIISKNMQAIIDKFSEADSILCVHLNNPEYNFTYTR